MTEKISPRAELELGTTRSVGQRLPTELPRHLHIRRRTSVSAKPEKQRIDLATPGPEVIKMFSCSTQLSMKF